LQGARHSSPPPPADKAQALAAYAKQAKDNEMVAWATEIKVRAERRCGQMLRDAAETGQRAHQGGDRKSKSHDATLKLADLGVSKDQSSRWQKLAAIPEAQFEKSVAIAKEVVGEVPAGTIATDSSEAPILFALMTADIGQ
jgi:hypothetical protein